MDFNEFYKEYWHAASGNLAHFDGPGSFHPGGWQPGCGPVITGDCGRSVHNNRTLINKPPSKSKGGEGGVFNLGEKNYDLDNYCNFVCFVASWCIWIKGDPKHAQWWQPGSCNLGYRGGPDCFEPSWGYLTVQVQENWQDRIKRELPNTLN